MRLNHLISAVLFLGLAGCQLQELEPGDGEIGVTQQESIGGQPAQGQAHYEAVAAITILLPLDNADQDPAITPRTEYRRCTGVLVEARTVMTAAGCFSRNYEFELDEDRPEEYLDELSVVVQFGSSASAGTEYYLDASFNTGPSTIKGLTMHRYYTIGTSGVNDVALLRLSADPGITPAVVNGDALNSDLVGMPLELVGYGRNDDSGDELNFTARNVVTPDIVSVTDTRVKAGTIDETTCFADQGGPGFLVFDAVPKVATLSSLHDRSECLADPTRQRVDIYVADFIQPFIDFHGGTCEDGVCDDCAYNTVCKEDCPTRDWDCEIGVSPGNACNIDGDCEEGGQCIPATDAPEFTYCSKSCDAEADNPCPGGLSCEAGECIYVGISPGSQGASCASPDDCRSGYCENSFCAYECDPADANACDTDNDFFCLPAASDDTPVCRKDTRSGGGGFCAVSPAGSRGQRNGLLICLSIVLVGGIVRRRRWM